VTVLAGGAREARRISNLSLGGAYIVGVHLPMGTRITLTWRLPVDDLPIEAASTVQWDDPGGIGARFDGLRARDVWVLNMYFASLPPVAS
jgi:hypothetical protein